MKCLEPAVAATIVPRPAATTIVLRGGDAGLEVLMVRRSLQASFMPGAFVFPGGAVDAEDALARCDESRERLAERIGRPTGIGDAALAFAVAALRECEEECNLRLGADRVAAGVRASSVLQPWSRWVTPLGRPKRFDTLFFVAPCPPDQTPAVDAGETTHLAWINPVVAMTEHAAGRFPMEFATRSTLQSLHPFASAADVQSEAASRRSLPTVHPRLKLDASGALLGVVLPGDPDYPAAAAYWA